MHCKYLRIASMLIRASPIHIPDVLEVGDDSVLLQAAPSRLELFLLSPQLCQPHIRDCRLECISWSSSFSKCMLGSHGRAHRCVDFDVGSSTLPGQIFSLLSRSHRFTSPCPTLPAPSFSVSHYVVQISHRCQSPESASLCRILAGFLFQPAAVCFVQCGTTWRRPPRHRISECDPLCRHLF